jgi:hypothetical protein
VTIGLLAQPTGPQLAQPPTLFGNHLRILLQPFVGEALGNERPVQLPSATLTRPTENVPRAVSDNDTWIGGQLR